MRGERGVALVVTMLALTVLSAIGASLVLATNAELAIAANAGASTEAFYAAEAAFDRAVAEMRTAADLSSVLNGTVMSAFTDGPPSGTRTLSDGSVLALDSVRNLANCHKPGACGDTEMNAALRGRPWGARNPRWRLFSYGPLEGRATSGHSNLAVYLVTMVADDPLESDNDPLRDGAPSATAVNPGAGIVLIRAEAFGRRGARRIVQGAVIRRDVAALARWEARDPAIRGPAPVVFPLLQVLAWEEIR